MPFDSFDDSKQRVRDAVDIVDLVGGYLQLRREGRGFKALCPWHDDTRPSLQVNPDRQSFKCWVCDIGGDIFSFVMKMEGVEFSEALQMLADRAGISLKATHAAAGSGPADAKRFLYQAAAWVEDQYHQFLMHDAQAEPARRYLDQRGITEASIQRCRLGFAPDSWDWLQKRAAGTSYSIKTLETIGVVGRTATGRVYDRFKARVLFPIRDSQSRPIALGGRILPELAKPKDAARPEAAKYINSPETPLFSKSKQLYGLDLAREAIRKSRTVLVMEGYTDCIIAQQFGFAHAVAVLGTALGAGHINLLNRFGEHVRIVSVLDGDEAGRRRASEVLELFVANSADLHVLTLPDELDPCDFLLDRGANEFQKLLDVTVDALTHAENTATAGIDLDRDPHRASQALDYLLGVIAKAPKLTGNRTQELRLREDMILGRLARRFRLPEESLRERLRRLRSGARKSAAPSSQSADATPAQPMDPWECELLELLLLEPESITEVAAVVRADDLKSPLCGRILTRSVDLARHGVTPDFHRLLLEFDEPEIKDLLVRCDEQGRSKAERCAQKGDFSVRQCIQKLLESYRRREEDQHRRGQIAAIKEHRVDAGEEVELFQRLIEQERNRRGISLPMDG